MGSKNFTVRNLLYAKDNRLLQFFQIVFFTNELIDLSLNYSYYYAIKIIRLDFFMEYFFTNSVT